jgi:hypothetical protein
MIPEEPAASTPAVSEIQARLRDIASSLRHSRVIDPLAQDALAELLDELTRTLETENLPAAELTQLAERTAHLAQALHEKDVGLIAKAREGLQRAIGQAEAQAPLAVGLARKLLDALANIGI